MQRFPSALNRILPNAPQLNDPLEYCCLEMVNIKEQVNNDPLQRRPSELNVGQEYKLTGYKCNFSNDMVLPCLHNSSCKVLISITLYSQDFEELKGTMRGVIRDAQKMFAKQICTPDELLVLIIADGLDRIKVDGLLKKLEKLNLFRESQFRSRLWKRDYIKKSVKCEDGCQRYQTNKHLFEGISDYEERKEHKRKRHNNVLHCFSH